jgi:SAM-dependent methyltransferase
VREPSRAFQQQFYDKHFAARAPSTGDLYTHPLFSSFYDRLAGLALDRGPGPGAASARVLEVGCGEGLLGAAFARVARERGVSLDYTGVDLSESGLAQARPHVEGTLLQGDAAEIVAGVPEKTYDVITIKNLLHHLDDPADLLRAVGRALAPGGRALVIEASMKCPQNLVFDLLAPRREWHAFKGARRSIRAIRDAGLQIVRTERFGWLWWELLFYIRFDLFRRLFSTNDPRVIARVNAFDEWATDRVPTLAVYHIWTTATASDGR